ncbi:MAG: aminoacyl-tRNA hydrolase [Nitrospira sp.]|nr:aminoacyl-tRNA hydrolase [Nitrospira sp.]
MRLLVGLGNPGPAYVRTRHNVGMWVIERAAARWTISLQPRRTARIGTGRLGSEPVTLAGLLDWMNITGPPIKSLLRELNLTPDDLILIHDDLDLEPGRLRVKSDGGHGGHNGVRSVIEALGTSRFVRVKIGIGRPAPGQNPADYVLEPVTADEMRLFDPCLERAVDALEWVIQQGVTAAMNRFNVRDRKEGGES